MTEQEYDQRFEAILRKFGGSLQTPAGWGIDCMYFSCTMPPIWVPTPRGLTAEQRKAVVERAEKQYGI